MAEIHLHSVGLSFGSYHAIHDVSFDIQRGQFVGLVGPTGCGKFSLLNLVAGLLKPTAGTIQVAVDFHLQRFSLAD
jgi:ABC-type sugar transport system ATPase subunit